MLMVVFGAGASYDSTASRPSNKFEFSTPYRLPLAKELFDDRPNFNVWIQRFPRCQRLVLDLRKPLGKGSIEHELERLKKQAETETYSDLQRELAAVQFYLQSMLWECQTNWKERVTFGVTNYKSLLLHIDLWRRESKEKVCLVTFNYDTMLEDAIADFDIKIRNLSDYVSHTDYMIIKLHGSVNWAHIVDVDVKDLPNRPALDVANELIDRRDELDILHDFLMVNLPLGDPGRRLPSEAPWFPALAIPVENKQEYECPEEHVEVLRNCIPEVTKMLLIGWRATETRFLELLKEKLQKKIIVKAVNGGQDSEKDTVNRLASALDQAGISTACVPSDVGFSDFVNFRQVDAFLRS